MQSPIVDTEGNTNKRRQGPDHLQAPTGKDERDMERELLGKSQLLLDVPTGVSSQCI